MYCGIEILFLNRAYWPSEISTYCKYNRLKHSQKKLIKERLYIAIIWGIRNVTRHPEKKLFDLHGSR